MPVLQSPKYWSDIMGAADIGDVDPKVCEFASGAGVLVRGTIVSDDGTGKMIPTVAAMEATVFGILLNDAVDLALPVSEGGSVTGTVARHGSFKASQLTVGVGADPIALARNLREIGILLEGDLVVPTTEGLPGDLGNVSKESGIGQRKEPKKA